MDALDVAALVVLAFNILILCPCYMYSLIIYRRHETQTTVDALISHRNSNLIYALNVLIIVNTLTERVFMVCAKVWKIIVVPLWSVDLWFSATWWAVGSLFSIKIYHLYFRQRLNMAVAEASWRKDINPNDTNWYIAHKRTFGNHQYLIKVAFLPYLSSVALSVIASVYTSEGMVYDLVRLTFASIPIAVAFFCLFKARKLNDIYFLRNEILWQSVITIISVCMYAASFSAGHYVHYSAGKIFAVRLEWFGYLCSTSLVSVALALFSTLYPLYLIGLQRDASFLLARSNRSDLNVDRKSLTNILSDYRSFKLFMNHLVRELAAESLLFLVELTQIKFYYQQQHNGVLRLLKDNHAVIRNLAVSIPEETENEQEDENENEGGNEGTDEQRNSPPVPSDSQLQSNNNLCQVVNFNIKPSGSYDEDSTIFTYLFAADGRITTPIILPAPLPKTLAITSGSYRTLFQKLKFLYSKYVKTGSDNEINISWETREPLVHFFENAETAQSFQIFNIFDEAAMEILLLLHGSFSRFRKTPAYVRVCEYAKGSEVIFDSGELPILRNATSFSKVYGEYNYM